MDPYEMSPARRSSRALDPAEVDRVRALIRDVIRREGSQSAAAKALGVRQQTVSVALSRQEPGVLLTRRLAAYFGSSFEELLAGAPPPKRYEELPGWAAAAAEVVSRGLMQRYAVAAAGAMRASLVPEAVTPRLVVDLATLWLSHAPLDVRRAAETAEAATDLRAAEQAAKVKQDRK